jgi:DNA polymerase-3 subunit delta'
VGKQRIALWLGQLLLCEAPGATGPCGACRACRQCLHLEHADLHWFFPLPRPKVSGGPEKLGDALEDARAMELAARREDSLYSPVHEQSVGIFLAHVQVLRRLAQSRPAAGARKVFIVGDAEALVPQEASQEAANALLKLLEEPPADTTIVLTAAEPESLLPTIRSRVLPVRVPPQPADSVAGFLREVRPVGAAEAATAARLSGGSIGRALAFLPDGKAAGPLEEARQSAREMLTAALSGRPGDRLAAALGQAPAGARAGAFVGTLDFLAGWIRDLAAVDAGAEDVVVNVDALDWLRDQVRRHPGIGAGVPGALRAVDAATSLTTLNVNPQLNVAGLLRDVGAALV